MNDMLLFFASALTIHALAVMSPGPDFIMCLRQSVLHGRRAGIWTSVGFGVGILVHCAYCIAGIALIISQSIVAFNIIKMLGAVYLMYIGYQSWNAPEMTMAAESLEGEHASMSDWDAFKVGFLTNVLNVKATVFLLGMFTLVVTPEIPLTWQVGLSLIMGLNTTLWFSFVTVLLTVPAVRGRFLALQTYINKTFGVVLVGLGIKVALDQ